MKYIPIRVIFPLLLALSTFLAIYSEDISRYQGNVGYLLFTPSTNLTTTTQEYPSMPRRKNLSSMIEKTILHLNYTALFKIDDTDRLSELPELTCKPANFGYNSELD